eukprot:1145862-Rhodomonas_salina.1
MSAAPDHHSTRCGRQRPPTCDLDTQRAWDGERKEELGEEDRGSHGLDEVALARIAREQVRKVGPVHAGVQPVAEDAGE